MATTLARTACLLLLLMLTGCASSGSRSTTLRTANEDYHNGRYASAQSLAGQIARESHGVERQQASYVAGLAAMQQGDLNTAERFLETAEIGSDASVSGRARVSLGSLRMRQNRFAEAADLFARAADQLPGDESRQAALSASIAYSRAGNDYSAQRWRDRAGVRGYMASSSSSSVMETTHIPESTSWEPAHAFTLQVGAYREHHRATLAANRIRNYVNRNQLGEVRIIDGRDARGEQMHFVQFGRFDTEAQANRARAQLAGIDCIVAAARD